MWSTSTFDRFFLLCQLQLFSSGPSNEFNDSYSDTAERDSPVKGGRMTRLRARGGVRDRPPIIDEDDDDLVVPVPAAPAKKRKIGGARKQPVEREKEKPVAVEKPIVDRERDVTLDETSLYYIIRHSKSAIAVSINKIHSLPFYNNNHESFAIEHRR